MQDTSADFTMTFHQLGVLSLDNLYKNEIPESLWALKDLQQHERFSDWTQDYTDRARRAGGETRLTNREEIMNGKYLFVLKLRFKKTNSILLKFFWKLF